MKKLRRRGIMRTAEGAAEDQEALLPAEARPTHEVRDPWGSASSSALTLLPNTLLFPPRFRGRLETGIRKTSERSPFSFCPPRPRELAQKEVGRWQLQFRALASRGQQSSTGGQGWGSREAQPSPLHPASGPQEHGEKPSAQPGLHSCTWEAPPLTHAFTHSV